MFLKISPFRFISIFLFTLIIFSFAGKISAQLDPTFGTNGVVTTNLGASDTTLATYVLPDGKIFMVAVSVTGNQQQKTFFIKYNSNGTLDSTYGTNGSIQLPIPYFSAAGGIVDAARQTDGKIVVAGYDYSGGVQRFLVARFNEDGTINTSFAGGSGISRPIISQFDDAAFSLVLIQPDGKILLAGGSEVNGNGQFFAWRAISRTVRLIRVSAATERDLSLMLRSQKFKIMIISIYSLTVKLLSGISPADESTGIMLTERLTIVLHR